MLLSRWIEPKRCYQLIIGIAGIYVCYLTLGVVQETILKGQYAHDTTGQTSKFKFPSATIIAPNGLAWFLAALINHFTIPANQRVHIPNKKSAICGLTITIAILTYLYVIQYTNYPVVMMVKSCNLLSVLLVGVFCSKVRDKQLKLGTKKLLVGVAITLAIVVFKVFDPESSKKAQTKTQVIGVVLLIVSLLADGFLPDFQAEIKSQYKPRPMQMLLQINKWTFIVAFLYSCAILEIGDMLVFVWNHSLLGFHLLLLSICAFVGHLFIYRMIKQFKQHFVPFVITTRKIFTVGLSIVWYGHETNVWQILGLVAVLVLVVYEFVSELMEQKSADGQKDMMVNPKFTIGEQMKQGSFQMQNEAKQIKK